MAVHIMVFRQQPTNYLYFTTIAGLFEVRLSLFMVLSTKKKLCYDKGNAIARQLRHRPEKTGWRREWKKEQFLLWRMTGR